jgi:AraC-like DNA-binding protein
MRKFVNIIEANLSNVDFSVEDAQDALKVSRWHLLSKVKSLVGLTPNEFIKETRLAHAAKLIDEGELNMTQIAYTMRLNAH